MHAKNNRVNKNFQILHFLAGSCHTPDGAYSLLKDLQEDREMALSQIESNELKKQAKIIRAHRLIASEDAADQLEGKAELAEINNNRQFANRNIKLDLARGCCGSDFGDQAAALRESRSDGGQNGNQCSNNNNRIHTFFVVKC